MEVINENKMPENPRRGDRNDVTLRGNIYLGVVLVLIGFLWLFRNMGWVGYGIWDTLMSWQMLLVVIGGYLLVVKKWAAGIIVGGVGVLFVFMDILDVYISVSKVILPVVVIAVGVSLLVTRLGSRDK